VACDVIAPSLVPVRPGDRIKTDRRDAKKLVRFFRAGELTFVMPPTPEQEGLRGLVRCREDLRDARTRARHRVIKALLRYGHVYSDGKHWTIRHRTWLAQQRLGDPVAQLALETMRAHLEMIETQIRTVDAQLERLAHQDRWQRGVRVLTSFRGIATLTALSRESERSRASGRIGAHGTGLRPSGCVARAASGRFPPTGLEDGRNSALEKPDCLRADGPGVDSAHVSGRGVADLELPRPVLQRR
jgi:transposase